MRNVGVGVILLAALTILNNEIVSYLVLTPAVFAGVYAFLKAIDPDSRER